MKTVLNGLQSGIDQVSNVRWTNVVCGSVCIAKGVGVGSWSNQPVKFDWRASLTGTGDRSEFLVE